MVLLALAGFVLLVATLALLSSRQGPDVTGCCAPADPHDDLRMRAAYDDDRPREARPDPAP